MSRTDDDTNVLCLGADFIALPKIRNIVRIWLNTKKSVAKRHARRINKIKRYEIRKWKK